MPRFSLVSKPQKNRPPLHRHLLTREAVGHDTTHRRFSPSALRCRPPPTALAIHGRPSQTDTKAAVTHQARIQSPPKKAERGHAWPRRDGMVNPARCAAKTQIKRHGRDGEAHSFGVKSAGKAKTYSRCCRIRRGTISGQTTLGRNRGGLARCQLAASRRAPIRG